MCGGLVVELLTRPGVGQKPETVPPRNKNSLPTVNEYNDDTRLMVDRSKARELPDRAN